LGWLPGFENDLITEAAERQSKLLGAALPGFGIGVLSLFDEADLLVRNQPYQPGKPVSDDPHGALIAEFKNKTAEYVLEVRPFFLDGRVPMPEPFSEARVMREAEVLVNRALLAGASALRPITQPETT
jgi:hypothetical protein